MNVYIVWFYTGDIYDDETSEINSIFLSKRQAEIRVKSLMTRLSIMKRNSKGNNDNSKSSSTRYETVHLDNHRIDYTGAYVSISGPYEVEDT